MIEINNLRFYYKKSKPIFENVSLEMKSGIYGLLGENGVGKTTLLHIISGLLYPKEGECTILGYDTTKRNPQLMNQIYYLPEEFQTPPLKIKDYVKANAAFYPNFNQEQFKSYLDDFHLEDDLYFPELSFGQIKKAAIAYAIALNTPITLLDEPTNGLDIPSKAQFRKIIASAYDESKCFVISTHQVRDLENMIDPIIILDRSQVLLNNTVEEITEKLLFTFTQQKQEDSLYSEQTMQGFASVLENKNKEASSLNIETLFNAVVTNKAKIKELFNTKD